MANTRTTLGAVAGAAFVALLLGISWHSQRVLELGLPPRDESDRTQAAALLAANGWALANNGGTIAAVLGTGSMAPYIPAGDPAQVVAYAVTRNGATFDDVTPGAVCVYRHSASPVGVTIHGAAERTGSGWVMSGLHNSRSDIRMTRENFVGIVVRVFVWGK